MYPGAYFILILPYILIWAGLFIMVPRLRPYMVWPSLVMSLAGPLAEYWHLRDYWYPDYLFPIQIRGWRFGIEDYIFCFFQTGIFTAVFEIIVSKQGWKKLPPVSLKSLFKITRWGAAGFLMLMLFSWLDINSVHALNISLIILSLVFLARKPTLFFHVLPIAACSALFYTFYYPVVFIPLYPGIIEKWWNLSNTLGIQIFGIPIEESVWAFASAFFVAPLSRICAFDRIKDIE